MTLWDHASTPLSVRHTRILSPSRADIPIGRGAENPRQLRQRDVLQGREGRGGRRLVKYAGGNIWLGAARASSRLIGLSRGRGRLHHPSPAPLFPKVWLWEEGRPPASSSPGGVGGQRYARLHLPELWPGDTSRAGSAIANISRIKYRFMFLC